MILSVLFLAFTAYMFISSRWLDRQLEEQKEKEVALDNIAFLEHLLLCLIIEAGALDLYDPEIQDLLRRLIAAQRAYMEKYGVDWEAGIARKMALLREV